MSAEQQPTVPYQPFGELKRRRRPPLGRLIWPWSIVTTNTTRRAPLAAWNRYPGQVIGIHVRLPDGPRPGQHYGLSIRWGRPT